MSTYTATIGPENAAWLADDDTAYGMGLGPSAKGSLGTDTAGDIATQPGTLATNLGDGRVRLTQAQYDLLVLRGERDGEAADGQIADGCLWIGGDGYRIVREG